MAAMPILLLFGSGFLDNCCYPLEGADAVNTSLISPSSKQFNSSKWMLKTGIQIPTVNHKFDPLALFQDLNMTLVQK